ncbi:T9SS type A sorting domain-containing protein [Algibacter sp. L4_22]
MNLAHLSSGMYLIKMEGDYKTVIKRIVKQ